MGNLNFSIEAFEALTNAPKSSDAAAHLLLIAARYIRNQEPLPMELAEFIADAIESSMTIPDGEERIRKFLLGLHLTSDHRRPEFTNWYEIGCAMDDELHKDHGDQRQPARVRLKKITQNQAALIVSKRFGASPATVVRLYKKYKDALKDALKAEEDY
jgi:hypothetical protein